MRNHPFQCHFAIVALMIALTGQACAQYDRDGRYVPSPNGVPADPNAKIVRGFPGTPGPVIGEEYRPQPTTTTPRSVFSPRIADPRGAGHIRQPTAVSPTVCAEGWSKRSGMTRTIFKMRCERLARAQMVR